MVVPLYEVTAFTFPVAVIPNKKFPVQRDYGCGSKDVENIYNYVVDT
jgi:hypothetical protein